MAIFIQTFHPNMDGEITLRFFLQFRLTGYVLFIIGIIVSGIVNKILVDARDSEEYRKRVQYLYDFLNKNGLKVDINNRNPSRLSRTKRPYDEKFIIEKLYYDKDIRIKNYQYPN